MIEFDECEVCGHTSSEHTGTACRECPTCKGYRRPTQKMALDGLRELAGLVSEYGGKYTNELETLLDVLRAFR